MTLFRLKYGLNIPKFHNYPFCMAFGHIFINKVGWGGRGAKLLIRKHVLQYVWYTQ